MNNAPSTNSIPLRKRKRRKTRTSSTMYAGKGLDRWIRKDKFNRWQMNGITLDLSSKQKISLDLGLFFIVVKDIYGRRLYEAN